MSGLAPTTVPRPIISLWNEAKLRLTPALAQSWANRLGVRAETLWEAPFLGATAEGGLAFPIEREGRVVALHVLAPGHEGKAYTTPRTTLTPLLIGHVQIAETIHVFSSNLHLLGVLDRVDNFLGFPVAAIVDRCGHRQAAEPEEDIVDLISPKARVVVWQDGSNDAWAEGLARCLLRNDVVSARFVRGGDHAAALRDAVTIRRAPLVDPDSSDELPYGAVPLLLRRLVWDMMRVYEVQPIMPLLVALSCASGATFARVRLEQEESSDSYAHSNTYALIVAGSGGGKSVIGDEIAGPIRRFNNRLIALNKARVEEDKRLRPALEQDKAIILKARARFKEANPGAATPELDQQLQTLEGHLMAMARREEVSPGFIATEFTSASLEKKLSHAAGEFMFGLHTDARKAVRISLGGLYQKGAPDDSLLLQGFSGDSHDSGRVGRGEVHIDAPRLSVCWLTQPDQTDAIINSETVKGGTVPRFFLAYPTEGIKRQGRKLESGIKAEWSGFLTDLARFGRTLALRQEYLDLIATPETYAVFNRFAARIYEEVESKSTNLAGAGNIAARWPEKAVRVALLLHLLEHAGCMSSFVRHAEANNEPGIAERIPASMRTLSKSTAEAAVELVLWLAREELRLVTPYLEGEARKREDKVLEVLGRKGGLTQRELVKYTHLSGVDLGATLRDLTEKRRIRTVVTRTTRYALR